jgi:magnesium-protoporphyrin IX monomethyl ester (oxidative) cyclase
MTRGPGFRVALVNPPFGNFRRPSLALTQLRSAVRASLPHVQVDIHHLTLDCAVLLGTEWYTEISDGFQSWTGLGDWLFRRLAFPDAEDNARVYLDWLVAQGAAADGFEARVLESRRLVCDRLPALIAARQLASYDVVGVTSTFAQSLAAAAILRTLKRERPGIVTVMGGANCESPMGEALLEALPFVDAVFSGRALRSFTEFLSCVAGERSLASMPVIPGVLLRSSHAPAPEPSRDRPRKLLAVLPEAQPPSAVKRKLLAVLPEAQPPSAVKKREQILSEVPELDYDDFIREFTALGLPDDVVLSFETSTGCWWGQKSHCTFCGLNSTSMEYRALPADAAVLVINGLVERYSHVCHTFEAVDNILSHHYLTSVLPKLKIPEHVSLFYEVKANLSEDQVRTLAESGVRRIQPGVEALSTEALDLFRKGITAPRNVALLRHCRAYGVCPDWNILVSIPGESPAIYDLYIREFPKLFHLEPPAGAFEIRFDRYSPYFDRADQFSLHLVPFPFYAFLYPFDEPWLRRIAYFFADPTSHAERRARLGDRLQVVGELIAAWKARHHAGPPPRLELHDAGRPRIVDTRTAGIQRETVLEPVDVAALDHLRRPRTLHSTSAYLLERGFAATTVAAALAKLHDHGWLFEEGDEAISIVVDRCAPRVELAAPPASSWLLVNDHER